MDNMLQDRLCDIKEVLESFVSPFMCEHIRLYQTESDIFFLSRFSFGKQLPDFIDECGGFLSPVDANFFAANLVLFLQSIHNQQIVYREIEPDSFLIDRSGYLRVLAFNNAKLIGNQKNFDRTFTVIGSILYMDPDRLRGKGHSYSSDLWSLGIFLYEILVGSFPFGKTLLQQDGQAPIQLSPIQLYDEIVGSKTIQFPEDFSDLRAKNFIQTLLNINSSQRFGGSLNAVKAHFYFEDVKWEDMYERTVKANYIPEIRENQEFLLQENKTFLDWDAVFELPQKDESNTESFFVIKK